MISESHNGRPPQLPHPQGARWWPSELVVLYAQYGRLRDEEDRSKFMEHVLQDYLLGDVELPPMTIAAGPLVKTTSPRIIVLTLQPTSFDPLGILYTLSLPDLIIHHKNWEGLTDPLPPDFRICFSPRWVFELKIEFSKYLAQNFFLKVSARPNVLPIRRFGLPTCLAQYVARFQAQSSHFGGFWGDVFWGARIWFVFF